MRRRWRELTTYDTWNVGIVTLPRPLVSLDDLRLDDVRWLPAQPPLHYLADPFPYRHDGRELLLVERYGHPRGVHGDISRVDLSTFEIEPVISRRRHLSYPFVFEAEGAVYCAPEMSQESGCVLYRLQPDGAWTACCEILPGRRVVDPTIFRHGGLWWLFGSGPPPMHNTTLDAYFAERVSGPWTAHPANPLKRDRASARSAGRPFRIGPRLFRPAQDCSRTYGGAVHVMEIVELTAARFEEVIARRLEPCAAWPYPDGLHHLVVEGTRVYIDAKKTRRDFLLPMKVRGAPIREPRP
jgi:hypothetical protein